MKNEKIFTPYFRRKLKLIAVGSGLTDDESKELVKQFEEESVDEFFNVIKKSIKDAMEDVSKSRGEEI